LSKNPAPTFDPRNTAEGAEVRRKRDNGHAKSGKAARNGATDKPPPDPLADLEELPPPFSCYYFPKKGKFYTQSDGGDWVPVGLEEVRRDLSANGVNRRTLDGKMVSDQDKTLRHIQRKCLIDAAMPLAGFKAGFREVNGKRLLVTNSPKTPVPRCGDCATISKMFREFCGVGVDPHGEEQYLVFSLWLARAFRQIHEGTPLPGHCLILAGPKAACKTMIQERIISAALGGRKAKAALVFTKDKEFTADLAETEHIYLADELISSDYRTRMSLAEKIKSFVANRFHSVHPKGVDQMTLDPRWRVTISLNDTPDRMAMLPPLDDEDLADKVILLRCYPVQRPTDDGESEAWIERVLVELPAFVHEILQLKVPARLRETEGVRFGFKAFRHSGLMADMAENEAEASVMEIINKLLFWEPEPDTFAGTAHRLRSALFEKAEGDAHTLRELQRLCPSETRMGQIMARLASRHPKRITKIARWGSRRGWEIKPPLIEEQEAQATGYVQSTDRTTPL
jgi:hypothetical protein